MATIGYHSNYENKSPIPIIKKKDAILPFDSKKGINVGSGIDAKDLNHHLIVLGTTGAGKTRSVVLPSLYQPWCAEEMHLHQCMLLLAIAIQRLFFILMTQNIGKDYIIIFDTITGKSTRLKGTIYLNDFDGIAWKKAQFTAWEHRSRGTNTVELEKAQIANSALKMSIEKSARYNQKRYKLINEKEFTNGKQQSAKASIVECAGTDNTREISRDVPKGNGKEYAERATENCGKQPAINTKQSRVNARAITDSSITHIIGTGNIVSNSNEFIQTLLVMRERATKKHQVETTNRAEIEKHLASEREANDVTDKYVRRHFKWKHAGSGRDIELGNRNDAGFTGSSGEVGEKNIAQGELIQSSKKQLSNESEVLDGRYKGKCKTAKSLSSNTRQGISRDRISEKSEGMQRIISERRGQEYKRQSQNGMDDFASGVWLGENKGIASGREDTYTVKGTHQDPKGIRDTFFTVAEEPREKSELEGTHRKGINGISDRTEQYNRVNAKYFGEAYERETRTAGGHAHANNGDIAGITGKGNSFGELAKIQRNCKIMAKIFEEKCVLYADLVRMRKLSKELMSFREPKQTLKSISIIFEKKLADFYDLQLTQGIAKKDMMLDMPILDNLSNKMTSFENKLM